MDVKLTTPKHELNESYIYVIFKWENGVKPRQVQTSQIKNKS